MTAPSVIGYSPGSRVQRPVHLCSSDHALFAELRYELRFKENLVAAISGKGRRSGPRSLCSAPHHTRVDRCQHPTAAFCDGFENELEWSYESREDAVLERTAPRAHTQTGAVAKASREGL